MARYLQRHFLFLLFYFSALSAAAQTATLQGKVKSKSGEPLEFATIGIPGTEFASQTDKNGRYSLVVPAGKPFTLQVSFVGFKTYSSQITLKPGQTKNLDIEIERESTYLQPVEVKGSRDELVREQVSITKLNPRETRFLPSAFGDFNKVLATLPGVVSNNELSSTYSVRGGNFDENLVYVDNFEIYRPNLVSNGQQEGLSFVNPDMVSDVEFSSGGWQPKYGDKLSSVLNIKYKRPQRFGGTATASLTGGSLQLEGATKNKRLGWNAGIRHKNAALVYKSLDVVGNYRPRFTDFQSFITYDISSDTAGKPAGRTVFGVLASYANNDYRVTPETGEASFGTLNQVMRVNIYFDGHDLVTYNTYQGGVSIRHKFNNRFSTEFIASAVHSREREFRDVEAAYWFCEVNTDPSSPNAFECMSERNVGSSFTNSRNTLLVKIAAIENRSVFTVNPKHELQGGFRVAHEDLTDEIQEYSFFDSTDYVINNQFLYSANKLQSQRVSGYLQHSWEIDSLWRLTYGARANYWTLSEEFLISPRAQISYKPSVTSPWQFKAAAGLYHQPPFYRELRDLQGRLNRNLKAQQSLHAVLGADYTFTAWGRDFKFRTEAYYKYLTNVIPYDVDNVRIRYYARNNATAYAAGIDTRINGEFIKGAESWFSLGVLTTRENVEGDYKINRRNVNGVPTVTDSTELGYIRRPTDQLITLGAFFQDHLPNNPTVKMYLNGIFGSGLVTGVPGSPGTRGQFDFPAYYRLDVGFSKLITFREEESVSRTGFFQSIWIGAEVLNIIDASNTISYTFVKDFDNRQYAVPNTLSGRMLNVRMVARF